MFGLTKLSKQDLIFKKTIDIETPFFLLDFDIIRQKIKCFNSIFDLFDTNFELYYSVKTNYNPSIIKFLSSNQVGLEIISGFEVDLLNEIELLDEKVIINGPAKSRSELHKVINANSIIQTDSLEEISDINEISSKLEKITSVGLRIQPDFSNWKRFGIPQQNLSLVINEIKNKYKNIKIVGLHSHLGSQILDINAYRILAEQLAMLAIKNGLIFNLEYLNLGGGFPSYSAPLTHHKEEPKPLINYFKEINIGLKEVLFKNKNIKILIEPGRALVDESMDLVCSVMSSSFDKIVLDTGKNDIPSLNIRNHPIYFNKANIELKEKDIYGALCMRSDSFPIKKKVPFLERGDRAIISTLGAYVNSQSMTFIKYKPPIYSYDSSNKNLEFKLIQRRQTIKDIMERFL